jgi:hypothetical protein
VVTARTDSQSPASAPRQRRTRRTQVGPVARWLLPPLGGLCLLLVFYLLVTGAERFLLDSDAGWHVRAGDAMRAGGAVLSRDVFSHTMPGREWFAWEWLADVLMSRLHEWRGLPGVVGGAILLLAASYAGLYRLMLARGADAALACGLTIFAALASVVHWLARPHLFSIALLVAWVALTESYRRRRSGWIYAVPLLYPLWANLHGAFVVTFPLFAIYAAGEALEFFFRREPGAGPRARAELFRALKPYAAAALLSLAATLATPHGVRLYAHLWRYLTDSELLALIHEFQSPSFHTLDGKLIEVWLLLGVAALVRAARLRRFVDIGLLLFWAHLVLRSERHVTLAVVVTTPIMAEHLSAMLRDAAATLADGGGKSARFWRALREWYRGILAIDRQLTGAGVYAGALALLLFLIYGAAARDTLAGRLLPAEFDAGRFPAGAVEFIAATQADPQSPFHRQLTGHLFTGDQWGGYLIYRLHPRVKVFFDGRSDFYRQGRVLDDALAISSLKPEVAALLDRYEVRWLLVRRDEPLAAWARANEAWQSAYRDPLAEVFVRKE